MILFTGGGCCDSVHRGGAWSQGGSGGGLPGGDPLSGMATAAGSMHPTEMHSCFHIFSFIEPRHHNLPPPEQQKCFKHDF